MCFVDLVREGDGVFFFCGSVLLGHLAPRLFFEPERELMALSVAFLRRGVEESLEESLCDGMKSVDAGAYGWVGAFLGGVRCEHPAKQGAYRVEIVVGFDEWVGRGFMVWEEFGGEEGALLEEERGGNGKRGEVVLKEGRETVMANP